MTRKQKISFITLSVVITAGFVVLGAFVFRLSYLRFAEAVCDLWNSIQYYFLTMFGINTDINVTVSEYSKVITWDVGIPKDFSQFKTQTISFFTLLVDKENFKGWLWQTVQGIGIFSKIAMIMLPVLLITAFSIKILYGSSNTKHNKDTIPLKVYKRLSTIIFQPCKHFVLFFVQFLKENKAVYIVWLVIWAFNLNIAAIMTDFLAYYMYFSISFHFESIYMQIVKFFIDLQVLFFNFPWWTLLPGALLLFDSVRKKIAKQRLIHMENKNCGFINALPIVSMTVGAMGKKKTTAVTDMALSQEVMFREKAFELLQKNDMKFPYFPWIAFEKELQACMRHRTVYNLATVKEWVKLKEQRYTKHRNADWQLFGYDTKKYGMTYDDKLKISNLFEVLSTYAQLYFIYVIESSLLVTNYSIREDNLLIDEGNFPIWYSDFFPKRYPQASRYAHILDFDVLRLGKKVIEDNEKSGSFEFGVIVISEVGKERGNNLELKEVRKRTEDTNQKNDLFNSWLKMCRHSATVDNFPFVKVFTDEQRAETWGADARDLCDIVKIVKSREARLAMPFYAIEDMVCEWCFNRFKKLYYDFRFRRGDNTLLVHILKAFVSVIYNHNSRIYNRFGYCVLDVEKERGTMDGKVEKNKYYIMSKKIYSERFSTDCFSDYFNDMAKKTKVGLNEYMEYQTSKATVQELQQQNSYFINALYKDEED